MTDNLHRRNTDITPDIISDTEKLEAIYYAQLELNKLLQKHIEDFEKAMPLKEGNILLEEHKRFHEEQLNNQLFWKTIKNHIAEKTIAGAIWGLIIFVCLAAWESFKREIAK